MNQMMAVVYLEAAAYWWNLWADCWHAVCEKPLESLFGLDRLEQIALPADSYEDGGRMSTRQEEPEVVEAMLRNMIKQKT